ncbi:MAG TPA: hypothetical protein VG291_07605 [Xanthobacteraceae bacterium]|jgi:hypothetical protein|nr:hypothetical protein [Xanthobacteraceae bacterium]
MKMRAVNFVGADFIPLDAGGLDDRPPSGDLGFLQDGERLLKFLRQAGILQNLVGEMA